MCAAILLPYMGLLFIHISASIGAAMPQRGLIRVLAPFHYASVTLPDAERPAIQLPQRGCEMAGKMTAD